MQSHPAPSARLHHDRRAAIGRRTRRSVTPITAPDGVLVFIAPHMVAGVVAAAGVVPLDRRCHGLRQIADVLARTPGVRAIVLMAGGMRMTTLLAGPVTAWRDIGRVLGPGGAVLLHGDVAPEDQSLIDAAARLSGLRIVTLAAPLPATNLAANARGANPQGMLLRRVDA